MAAQKKTRMDWLHKVDTDIGQSQTAYGLRLEFDEEVNVWFAMMTAERAKSESLRVGKSFQSHETK